MKHGIFVLTVKGRCILLLVAVLAALTSLPLHITNITRAHTETETLNPGQWGDPGDTRAPFLTGTSYSNSNFVSFDGKPLAGPGIYEDSLQAGPTDNMVRLARSRPAATTYDSYSFPAKTTFYLLARSIAADDKVTVSSSPAQAPVPGTPTPTPTSTPAASALSAPTLTAASTGATTVELSWTPVNGAVSYELLVWWNGATDWQHTHDGILQGTSLTHRERTPGTTYFYIVAALDSSGVRGAWSAQVEVTVRESDPPTPTLTPMPTATPTASALSAPTLKVEPGEGQITLTWDAVANAESYELIVWDQSTDDWRGIGGVLTGTSYTHSGVTPGAEYFYHIRAVADGGLASAWSEYANATVSETQSPTVTPTFTPASPISQAAAAEERAALVALYEATDGVNWKRSDNWLTNEPISDWFGVHTDERGHVSNLALDNNRLRGSVPDLGALKKLRSLRLAYNQLTGPIPDLNKLTKLNLLQLHSNRLNGSIPDLSALTNLTFLYLVGNELSGQIPDLDALANLVVLDLGSNQLSGPIPDVGDLTNLRLLSLRGNQLTGQIPDLRSLTHLTALNLGSNQLTGPIPDLNSFAYLTGLYLNDNKLTGQIRDLSLFTSLKRLSLNGNRLTGKIPELHSLSSLEDLDLSHNRLTGEIPELKTLTELRWLDLSHNRLTGEIPELDALTLLKGLVLNDNKLSGHTPDLGTLANLAWLNLSDNTLTGPVLDLNILINLEGLLLSNNRLTGPVPDLSALANLAWLDLRNNVLCLPVLSVLSSSNRVVSSHLNRLNLDACADA